MTRRNPDQFGRNPPPMLTTQQRDTIQQRIAVEMQTMLQSRDYQELCAHADEHPPYAPQLEKIADEYGRRLLDLLPKVTAYAGIRGLVSHAQHTRDVWELKRITLKLAENGTLK